MRRFTLIFTLILAGALATGCYYKMDIQQGNVITQEMVDQLKPGMTKRQVNYVLGTPLVNDPFHLDRWDYVYTLRKGNQKAVERRKLTLFFQNDALARIETGTDGESAAAPDPAAPAGTLSAEDTIVVKGDGTGTGPVPGKKKKGFLRRMWDKITD